MEPLSCKNCCHNPLQLGLIGTTFGFCTRHETFLLAPHLTTCGQLFRKDLRAKKALRARAIQQQTFRPDQVSLLAEPPRAAAEEGLVDTHASAPPDAVVEEVTAYGLLGSKIATMAALRRIDGVRAEIAMISLGRGYFQNCIERTGKWTSGVHLLQWTLARLTEEPILRATDLLGPMPPRSMERTTELAIWEVIFFRLIFVADIAQQAQQEEDPLGQAVDLLGSAIEKTQPGSPESLLTWLRKHAAKLHSAFPPARYDELRRALRKEDDAAA